MIGITRRQERVLDYIRKHVKAFKMPPTRHEIAVEFGFASDNAVQCHLKALEQKGFINITPRISRGIRVLT